jgi:flagellar hook-associated protein 3 FlgL
MRVPDNLSYSNAIQYMTDAKAKLDKLANRAATTKNFQNSSDDPSLVSSSLALRSSVVASDGYISSSNNAQSWMDDTESAFSLMNDQITTANTLMLSAVSDTTDATSRTNDYSVQITQILNQAISIANTAYNDNYLFAGTQINSKPFTLAADGSSVISNVDTSGAMKRNIAPGVTITINTDGTAAFNSFFNALILAKHGLETNNATEMNSALSQINSSLSTMNQYRTNNAAILRQVGTNIDHLTTTQNELKGLLSIKEDANMAEAISTYNLQQTTYQTVLDVCSRAISVTNLFDALT